MSTWKVFALRAGRSQMDQSMATYLDGMGEPLVIPHTMFAVLGAQTIVVDTSFESPEAVKAAYPQDIWRDPEEHPVALLREVGVAPDGVDLVVCTHLHYDHCGCNELFPAARVLVQRRELDYAMAPVSKLMLREFFSPAGGFVPPFDASRLELVDGDQEVAAGVSLVTLPGHTPGSQGVLVDTAHGRLALAGDLVMVHENFDEEVPVGLHTDLDAWYRSMEKLKGLTDRAVPSHDMRVFADGGVVAEVA
jgi:glyoxylase-like metal-dependent hydrolase (beta-lactamase superfamily II)